MNRADYEATLRVVLNPTANEASIQQNESMYDMEEDPFGEIGMVNRCHDFVDRTGVVIKNFNIL